MVVITAGSRITLMIRISPPHFSQTNGLARFEHAAVEVASDHVVDKTAPGSWWRRDWRAGGAASRRVGVSGLPAAHDGAR